MAAARTETRISTKRKMRPDFATLLGIAVACAGILGGLILEGGSVRDITQPTAALIVIGGTIGAVMVNITCSTLRRFSSFSTVPARATTRCLVSTRGLLMIRVIICVRSVGCSGLRRLRLFLLMK